MQQPFEITVKTYKKSKHFRKDQPHMAKQGWQVQNVVANQANRSSTGKLLVPGGMFTKKSEIIVTYSRPNPHYRPPQMPPPHPYYYPQPPRYPQPGYPPQPPYRR